MPSAPESSRTVGSRDPTGSTPLPISRPMPAAILRALGRVLSAVISATISRNTAEMYGNNAAIVQHLL